MNPFAPTADPRDALAYCEDAVRRGGWFQRAGLDECWPLPTETIAQILRASEYDVAAEQLTDLIGRNLITRPAVGEDGFEWNAQDFQSAALALEGRQQWAPSPSHHDFKKHPARIELEQARARGSLAAEVQSGPKRFDARDLIARIMANDNPQIRVALVALLEAVLEVEHGIVL